MHRQRCKEKKEKLDDENKNIEWEKYGTQRKIMEWLFVI